MSHVIASLIPAIVLSFVFIMTMDFIFGLVALNRSNIQPLLAVEEEVATPATIDWLLSVVKEEVVEEVVVDVLSLAKSRLPVVAVVEELIDLSKLGIRELKKLASQRKVKGYGKMNKAELVIALT